MRQSKNKYDKYALNEWAKADNKTILQLLSYHNELNPIELIWAQVKNFVAKENKTFKISHVKDLCMKSIGRIGIEEWKNYIQQVTNEVEKKMWDLDNVVDNVVDFFIINFSSNSSGPSSESDLKGKCF